jgi:DNA-binding ferritin-like protein (Dps family)
MIDYTKIIKDNDAEFKDGGQLIDFIDNYINETKEIEDLEDDITEFADSQVPIYYNDIMEEWRNNGECQGMADEAGMLGDTKEVYKIMQADLYAYYDNQLTEDYNTLMDLLEDQEEEPEPATPA